MNKQFAKWYFDDKPLDLLKKTITKGWNDKWTQHNLKILDIPDTAQTILEIGCGIGRLLKPIYETSSVTTCYGVDASKRMIEEAAIYCTEFNNNFSVCPGDGTFTAPPIDIDFVFSWLVFQHIDDIDTIIKYCNNMVNTLCVGGIIKCQLLRNNDKPNNPLWVWHDPNKIQSAMISSGCSHVSTTNISESWIIIQGNK